MSRDDVELMQHADGELDERADAEIRARLERDPDSRAVVDSLGEVGELVRGHLEQAGDAVPDRRFENMWRTINREIDTAPTPVVAPSAKRGLWSKIAGWFDRYRGHIITGAVSAGAVAALALILRPAGGGEMIVDNGTSAPIQVQPAAMRVAPVIESLETPGANATVLNLQDEDGHTAVIWVTPADTVEGI
jgi:anti-sigma factor RsiW